MTKEEEDTNRWASPYVKHVGFTSNEEWPFTKLFTLITGKNRRMVDGADFTFNRSKGTDYFYSKLPSIAELWLTGPANGQAELFIPAEINCNKVVLGRAFTDPSYFADRKSAIKAAKLRAGIQSNNNHILVGAKTSNWKYTLTVDSDYNVREEWEFRHACTVLPSNQIRDILLRGQATLYEIIQVAEIELLGLEIPMSASEWVLDYTDPAKKKEAVALTGPEKLAKNFSRAIIRHYETTGVNVTEHVFELTRRAIARMDTQMLLPFEVGDLENDPERPYKPELDQLMF
jgi:hypothetical protein